MRAVLQSKLLSGEAGTLKQSCSGKETKETLCGWQHEVHGPGSCGSHLALPVEQKSAGCHKAPICMAVRPVMEGVVPMNRP